ncbi:MAG: hypothetical protein AAF725_26020 [Acidobacteriota bacterium]
MAALSSDSSRLVVEESGHYLPIEAPEAVAAAALETAAAAGAPAASSAAPTRP